jgi:hypothetical protein
MREFSHFLLFYPNGSYSILVCIFLLESKAENSTWKRRLLELMENASSFLGLTARLIAYILKLKFDRLACRRFQSSAVRIEGNCSLPLRKRHAKGRIVYGMQKGTKPQEMRMHV